VGFPGEDDAEIGFLGSVGANDYLMCLISQVLCQAQRCSVRTIFALKGFKARASSISVPFLGLCGGFFSSSAASSN
jgi:hypothetical protein